MTRVRDSGCAEGATMKLSRGIKIVKSEATDTAYIVTVEIAWWRVLWERVRGWVRRV